MITWCELPVGPFVRTLGCFTPAQSAPAVVIAGTGPLPPHLVEFDDAGIPHRAEAQAEKFVGVARALRRSSGIQRATSAAPSTIYGATLGRALLADCIADARRTGVAVTSTTSTTGISYDFERRGLEEGWDLVDPIAFANVIPAAFATQLAIAFGLRAFAVAYLDSLFGFFHAFEYAAYSIIRGRADAALVLGAEEIAPIQEAAHRALRRSVRLCEGAAGLVVTRESPQGASWRVALVGHGVDGDHPPVVPPGWQDDLRFTISCANAFPVFHSIVPPFTLADLLHQADRRAVLCATVPSRGWRLLGFERIDA